MQKKRQPWGTWTPLTFPNPGQAGPTELHQLTERTPPTWQRRISCIFYVIQIQYNSNTNTNTKNAITKIPGPNNIQTKGTN